MPSYVRTSGKETMLWVVEIRGRVLWRRTGRAGNTGRFTSRELATPEAAHAALAEEVELRLAEGYVLLSPDASVDDRFLLPRDPSSVRKPARKPAPVGLLPSEIAEAIHERCAEALEEGTLDVRTAVSNVLDAIVQPCLASLRLGQITVVVGAAGAELSLSAIWMERGSQSHDTEVEGFELRAKVSRPPGLEFDEQLEDEIGVDYFVDDVRGPFRAMTDELARRLEQSKTWTAYGAARIVAFETLEVNDWSPPD